MAKEHRWLISTASGAAIMGIALSSGLVVLANKFIEELTQPGITEAEAIWGRWEVPDPEPEPPLALQRSLCFKVPNGPTLRGDFWAQPQAAPTIIVCHGYRVTRARLRTVATLEYSLGYNVLLFDFRGHGESEAVPTTGGTAEVQDLVAAVDLAIHQPETLPNQIFIHGFSMGASIALLTPPRAEIAGIIADSPYARLDDVLIRLIHYQMTSGSAAWRAPWKQLRRTFPMLAQTVVKVSSLVFRLRFHHTLLARPDAMLRNWDRVASRRKTPIPILLIHTLQDPLIPIAHAEAIILAAQAGHVPVDYLFVTSDAHCGAYSRDPVGYITAVQRFVARYSHRHTGAPQAPDVTPLQG